MKNSGEMRVSVGEVYPELQKLKIKPPSDVSSLYPAVMQPTENDNQQVKRVAVTDDEIRRSIVCPFCGEHFIKD